MFQLIWNIGWSLCDCVAWCCRHVIVAVCYMSTQELLLSTKRGLQDASSEKLTDVSAQMKALR